MGLSLSVKSLLAPLSLPLFFFFFFFGFRQPNKINRKSGWRKKEKTIGTKETDPDRRTGAYLV